MFGPHFSHDTTRRYAAIFGTLFNELTIKRGSKTIPVPLSYGPGSKDEAFNERNTLDSKPKVRRGSLPRMSYIYNGPVYSASRQGAKSKMLPTTSGGMYNRIPYDFQFDLKIKTKHIAEMNQIIEQILPYFDPTLNITAIDNEELNIKTDIAVSLDSISPTDDYEGDIGDDRILETTLSFVLEGFMYKPVGLNGGIIKQVDVSFLDINQETLSTITHSVNPDTANEDDPHTIDTIVIST